MTVWGAWSSNGHTQLGVDWAYAGNTLNVTVSLATHWSFSNNGPMTLAYAGSWAGSVNPGNITRANPSSGAIWSGSFTQGYNTTATLSFTLSGFYDGSGSNCTVTVYPILGPLAPSAPTAVAAVRGSDTLANVSWTNNATASAPYDTQYVYRRDNTAADAVVAVLGGGSNAFADTGIVADRRLSYTVGVTNSAGSATAAFSSNIYTTPAAPSALNAARAGNDIALSWTNNSTYAAACAVQVWHGTVSGGVTTWDGSPLYTTAVGGTTYTHTAPSTAVSHVYRVRAVSPTFNATTLYSDYATSGVVTLATAPNPPVVTGPAVADAADPVTITWSYSSPDTVDQTAANVRYRQQGTTPWTTVAVAGATKSKTLAGGTLTNAKTYEVQVQAQGSVSMGMSAWSATALLVTSAKPTATITNAALVQSSTTTVAWTYTDPEGAAQSAWSAELTGPGGVVLASANGTGQTASWAPAVTVANGTSGKRRVQVRDGAGVRSAWTEQTYTVTYALPATPTGSVTWDPTTGTATIAVAAGAGGAAATATLDVLRVDTYSGTPITTVVATGLADGSAVSDTDCPLSGSTYVVRAVSPYPSYASSVPLSVPVSGCWAYLSGGGKSARALWDIVPAPEDSWDRTVYVPDGRTYGIGIGTTKRAQSVPVSTHLDTADLTSSHDDFRAVAAGALVCLWRDPTGLYVRGIVGGLRTTITSATESDVAFTVQRVDA